MSDAPILSVELIMSAGLKRISAIAAKHGINSPETLAACERWGGILDDINYPDSTCRWCGHAVNYHSGLEAYVHTNSSRVPDFAKRFCWDEAPAVATPLKKPKPLDQVHTEAELAQVKAKTKKQVIRK